MTFASQQKKHPPGLLAAGATMVSAAAAYVLLSAISTAIAATTVVTPSSMDGWTVQKSGTASGMLVTGPATPPAGSGSMRLTVGSDGNSGVQVRNGSFSGTKLSDLTQLTYSTYVTSNNGCQAPYIVLDVDTNGNGTPDDLLFFEPCYQNGSYSGATVPNQGNVTLNTWQQWNALTGGWWSLNAGNGGPPLTTLSQYVASHSGATIVNSGTGSGGIRIDAGFGAPSWNNFSGNFDKVVIGTHGLTATYDFEPSGVNPSSSSSSTSSTSSSSNASLTSSSVSSSSTSSNLCAPTVSSSNLLGFWKFDEGSGTTTADSSGNGHTGMLQNGPTWTASGSTEIAPNPHALAYNGTNQDVRVSGSGGAFDFGSGSNFTVSADIKATSGNAGVLGNFSSGQRGWGLYLYGSNRVDFFAYGNQGHSDVSVPSSVNLLDGNWHTVTGVFTRSGSSLTIRTYADGNLIGTNTATVGDITSGSDLLLGRYLGQPAFNGSLDNVRVYGRSLSASEVSNLATACRSSSSSSSSTSSSSSSSTSSSSSNMSSSSTPTSTSSASSSSVSSSSISSSSLTSSSTSSNMCTNVVSNANLVGMWNFEEGSGSAAADSSGHGHTGILEHNPQWTASGASQVQSDPHAISFNGTNQDVRVSGTGGAFDFGSGTSFTVSAFVKTTTGNDGVLGNYSSAHRGWGLYLYGSNRVDFFAYGNQGTNDISIPSANVNLLDNRWHNITGVFTRSGNSITIQSYVDGTLIGTSTATVGDITSGSDLLLGRYLGQPAFNGSLDNVSVYARALSASEVLNLAGGCSSSSSSNSSTSSMSSTSSSVLSSSSSSTAGGVPTCGGLAATIYVNAQGKIVGGPDNGMYYGGMLPGTNGNDVIVGTSGADMILGGNGDDVICGGGGNDFINGGNGNDRIAGEAGNDYIVGGNGNDVLCGGAGNDVIFAENGSDRLDGGGGQDMLFGGTGPDVCAEGTVNLSCEQTQTTPLPDCAGLVSGMTNAPASSSSSMSTSSSSSNI